MVDVNEFDPGWWISRAGSSNIGEGGAAPPNLRRDLERKEFPPNLSNDKGDSLLIASAAYPATPIWLPRC